MDSDSRCLYAALHGVPARASTGVVFVPPLLHEQPRSRRFLTEAAARLAAMGLPCLRFDFFGTGDSDGSGDKLDFVSMGADLELAIAALRARAGVDRVVVLAWRGAALPVMEWLQQSSQADLLVLWEPIVDGADWLTELEQDDAAERASRPRPRPGIPRSAPADDGQLMGFAVSQRFRRDLTEARLVDAPVQPARTPMQNATAQLPPHVPIWAVMRHDAPALPIRVGRVLPLPATAPTFNGGASMEATFFLSPALERVVDDLGRALREAHAPDQVLLEQGIR
ncbi:hypothetical protein SNE32_08630 [Lysobacter sp. D1-1-M9]|uniref:hypothetical protein n=1 Tax=Novilysobacter longmucuonensis TaxID=3098603 RepID=UPI002FC77DBD